MASASAGPSPAAVPGSGRSLGRSGSESSLLRPASPAEDGIALSEQQRQRTGQRTAAASAVAAAARRAHRCSSAVGALLICIRPFLKILFVQRLSHEHADCASAASLMSAAGQRNSLRMLRLACEYVAEVVLTQQLR